MGSKAAERMHALRQRRKAAGCKTAKLWLPPQIQADIERLRRPGESLDALFARGLEAIEKVAPLQGKIVVLQTEYIAPLREEVAKLKKRLGNAPPAKPAAQPGLAQTLAQLQARNQRLEQSLDRLAQDLAQLRAQQERKPPKKAAEE
jgi:hypothetical protein